MLPIIQKIIANRKYGDGYQRDYEKRFYIPYNAPLLIYGWKFLGVLLIFGW